MLHKVKRIIYTQTFIDNYKKFWWKVSVDTDRFSALLLQDIAKQIRYLHRPYLKIKGNIYFKALRILAVYDEDTQILLPLLITDKNDKLYGDNMIWEAIKKPALLIYDRILNDVEQKEYKLYMTQ